MKTYTILVVAILLTSCATKIHQARIVLLPDTQTYAEKYPAILTSQANWIIAEKDNISFVLQQGDLTQNNNDKEWQLFRTEFEELDTKMPYVLAAGNHDMGSGPGKFADTRNTTLFNKYFPLEHMKTLPGFGGVFEPGKIENAWYLIKTGKIKWLVLTLEFGPRNAVLDWANQLVTRFPDHLIIVNTHAYLYSDSTRQSEKDYWRAQAYGVGKDTGQNAVNDGEQIWEKLVKKNANIRFVVSGHVLNTGVGTLVSINDAGYPVYQMLANYQEGVLGSVNGSNGWLRIIDVNTKKKQLQVSTFSPYLKEYNEHPAHQFLIREAFLKTGNK